MKPLQDIRIISLEEYGAGPFGAMHLAELGGEVIKIEDPGSGGDVGRYVAPHADGEDSLFFDSFNKNKSSMLLDIRTEAGARCSTTGALSRRGVPQPARRRPRQARHSARRPRRGRPAHRVLLADGVRDDRPARPNPATTTCCRPSAGGCR